MKIASPQIYHKTDAGGIRIDVATDEDVQKFLRNCCKCKKHTIHLREIHGVTVEPMVPIGKEVIIEYGKIHNLGICSCLGLVVFT